MTKKKALVNKFIQMEIDMKLILFKQGEWENDQRKG